MATGDNDSSSARVALVVALGSLLERVWSALLRLLLGIGAIFGHQ
jgi:hypothetical protein